MIWIAPVVSQILPVKLKSRGHVYSSRHVYSVKCGTLILSAENFIENDLVLSEIWPGKFRSRRAQFFRQARLFSKIRCLSISISSMLAHHHLLECPLTCAPGGTAGAHLSGYFNN